ncbi:hypothetical protein MJT46_007619 [Ovis ammon polii x Ovis aries]|nr:hypothetical protein MJT46_007619 [Ovis ammon polii x Ovis aries]
MEDTSKGSYIKIPLASAPKHRRPRRISQNVGELGPHPNNRGDEVILWKKRLISSSDLRTGGAPGTRALDQKEEGYSVHPQRNRLVLEPTEE